MTNTTPLVSVITPCYNDGHFLVEALESVHAQAYPHYEIVVVNDGSTDRHTLEILDTLKHDKIRIIHQTNTGLPGARNRGIREARAEYILPLDADDKIAHNYLVRTVTELDRSPNIDIVYGNYETFGSERRFVPTGIFNSYRILFGNYFPVCSLFRKSAWAAVGGYTEQMLGFEDWEFWIKLIEQGRCFKKIDEVGFYYRRHAASMWVRDRWRYRKIIKQITTLHPTLYTKESMRRLKRENRVTWLEDLIYHIPVPLRHELGKSFLRPLVVHLQRLGLYRDV